MSKRTQNGIILVAATFIVVAIAMVAFFFIIGKDRATGGSGGGEVSEEILSPESAEKAMAKEGSEEMDFGSFASDDYELSIPAGTFEKGAEVKVKPCDSSELAEITDDERYDLNGTPVNVTSKSSKGDTFGTDVTITLPIPGDEVDKYFAAYWDDEGQMHYMQPDSFDVDAGTMTVTLPHFCKIASLTTKEKEQIEHFLDEYAKEEAISRSEDKRAAEELEPYIREKTKNLGLTKDAALDLAIQLVNMRGAKYGEKAGTVTDATTAAFKSLEKGDPADFDAKMNEIISGKLVDMVDYNVHNGKDSSCFKDAGKFGTIMGAIAGGDKETALREIGDAIGSAVPGIGLATKAAGFVGNAANLGMTYWKMNQVEDLYQKFKNGFEGAYGNEVEAGNVESLKRYIYTGSGFSWAKGAYRFYNITKIKEICEMYGWGPKDYEDLTEKQREIFEKRAEEGLLKYFQTRMEQELVAQEVKNQERDVIEHMLVSYGALRQGNNMEFFKEGSRNDYNLQARLEKIAIVKRIISKYVDEDKLAKSAKLGWDGYNYGDLITQWIQFTEEYHGDKNAIISQFKQYLKELGFLKAEFMPKFDVSGVDAFMGEFVDSEGRRNLFFGSDGYVIRKNPDLSWYGGDIWVADYNAKYDPETYTLVLDGITSWVNDPDTLYDPNPLEHRLEIDAMSLHEEFVITKVKNGRVTEMTYAGYTYTRTD